MTKTIFTQLARYNQWANARLYAAARSLSESDYRRDTGVFFGSMNGTLNHILVADRVWLHRLTGEGDSPSRLDEIVHDDLQMLSLARAREDKRLLTLVASYEEADFDRMHDYATTSGAAQRQPIADILLHVFNHQTHHRGQAHACLSILTDHEPPALDLLAFQRGIPAPPMPETETVSHGNGASPTA